jgi:hypothetical protein
MIAKHLPIHFFHSHNILLHIFPLQTSVLFTSSFFYDTANISGRTGKSSTVKDLDGNNYDLFQIPDCHLLGATEKQQTTCQDCQCAEHDKKTAHPEFKFIH